MKMRDLELEIHVGIEGLGIAERRIHGFQIKLGKSSSLPWLFPILCLGGSTLGQFGGASGMLQCSHMLAIRIQMLERRRGNQIEVAVRQGFAKVDCLSGLAVWL
jgi:hypothetical protein